MIDNQSNNGGFDGKDYPALIQVLSKGTSFYYFNAIAEYDTNHTKVYGKIVFTCVASKNATALEKYRKYIESAVQYYPQSAHK